MDELVDAATKVGEHGHHVGEEVASDVHLKITIITFLVNFIYFVFNNTIKLICTGFLCGYVKGIRFQPTQLHGIILT